MSSLGNATNKPVATIFTISDPSHVLEDNGCNISFQIEEELVSYLCSHFQVFPFFEKQIVLIMWI